MDKSFVDFIIEYKIQIPIIQRDYVQGLSNDKAKLVRKRLLEDIYNSLIYGEPHDLGLLYGKTKIDNEEKIFIPFDGQQRITTLWLLLLYLYSRALYFDKEYNPILKNALLNHFDYQIRNTTIDFKSMLLDLLIDNPGLVYNQKNKIAKYIKDNCRFHQIYRSDPTVISMLGMLDDIEMVFAKVDYKGLIEKLSDRKCVYFNFIDMGDYKLSDDIYIKLNARGLALSDFENLKAKLIGIIKEKKGEKSELEIKFVETCDINWEDDFYNTKIKNEILSEIELENREKKELPKEQIKQLELEKIPSKIDTNRINYIRNFLIIEILSYMVDPRAIYKETINNITKIYCSDLPFVLDKFESKEIFDCYDRNDIKFNIEHENNRNFVCSSIEKIINTYKILKEIYIKHPSIFTMNVIDLLQKNPLKDSSNISALTDGERIYIYSIIHYVNKWYKEESDLENLSQFDKILINILDDSQFTDEYVFPRFISVMKRLINICNGDFINLLKEMDIDQLASMFDFDFVTKSNVIVEIARCKIDTKYILMFDEYFGKHYLFILELLGYITYGEERKIIFNINNDFDEKIINDAKKYICYDDAIIVKEEKIFDIRTALIRQNCYLQFKNGFYFGKNGKSLATKNPSFDLILRINSRDNKYYEIRKKIFNLIKDNISEQKQEYWNKLIMQNIDYMKEYLDYKFKIVDDKTIIFTDNDGFNGYNFDLFIFISLVCKSKVDKEKIKIKGNNGWQKTYDINGVKIKKDSQPFGVYYINGKDVNILNEDFSIRKIIQ